MEPVLRLSVYNPLRLRRSFYISHATAKSYRADMRTPSSSVQPSECLSVMKCVSARGHNTSPNRVSKTEKQTIMNLLKEILEYQSSKLTNWIVENKVQDLCKLYKNLDRDGRDNFLNLLAKNYSIDQNKVMKAINQYKDNESQSALSFKGHDQLKAALNQQYLWLFKHISRLEDGIKFLVDLRTDVLDLLSRIGSNDSSYNAIQQLNIALKDLLGLWFSVGFLKLERVTWKTSCEMLQKVSEYEAVHPVRNWTDLKRRVGPYRRCFVYTHSSMPSEPIVVLHTALCTEIVSSMSNIVVLPRHTAEGDTDSSETESHQDIVEDPKLVKAAIFYSVSSTQKGLQGIELGNYLIKRVVQELQYEFPQVSQFSTLSPIPTFKKWLMERLKLMEKDGSGNLNMKIWAPVLAKANNSWTVIRLAIHRNTWCTDQTWLDILKAPLMSTCAYYLYKEKRRGNAFDNVANFHLRNGAVMWRLNWMADVSGRGMSNSCGMMVNYRYYLADTETNSRNYIEKKEICSTEEFLQLLPEFIPDSKL